jgi:hypothetical protein
MQDYDIEKGAVEFMKQHGEQATAVAAGRADRCKLAGAHESAEFWLRIAQAARRINGNKTT